MAGITFYARREGRSLLCFNEANEEEMLRIPQGKTVEVTVVQRRGLPRQGFYFQMVKYVHKALQDSGNDKITKDIVDQQIRIGAGHCDSYALPYDLRKSTGISVGLSPRSISWHDMDEIQFSAFLDSAIGFVVTDILPYLPPTKTRQDILNLLDDEQRAKYKDAKAGAA